ncbi:MAG TPA: glycosyltransferase [Hydrogenophaga sp.]|uniref:glycosyltransferase n=1 Tax=Hydrogenophaga sp. TaxID=1904254 RepID=UPI002BBDF962|nr:glycosyltransferase [Hydrogenophaga sp.]HSX92403.1 glycosyltransferase [Hydrogenophaga sp.]
MKLLHVLPTVDAHGGGPMEGVRQRGIRLRELGHEVDLVTLDDPASPSVTGHPLRVHALGPTGGNYGFNPRLAPWLRAHAGEYDLTVVNGLWQYHSLATWRVYRALRRPYVVFTHGMLDPWFKQAYPLKHLKKWLYWPWAEYRVLRDASAVLFTSEEERRLARESFWLYRAREQVVAYGTRPPPANGAALAQRFLDQHPELRGKRLLLFLGRLHEKKGCDLLIDAFGQLAHRHPGLHLVMAGPDQGGQLALLKARAKERAVAHRVHWLGMVQGDHKWGALHACEAFVLPSHQENFGIAVAEALGCGLPVLISNKVNIWREVEQAGAGLVDDDDARGTARLLQRWLSLDADHRQAMSAAARDLFTSRYTVDAMAQSILSLAAQHGPSQGPFVSP